jgi:hypothetical protein
MTLKYFEACHKAGFFLYGIKINAVCGMLRNSVCGKMLPELFKKFILIRVLHKAWSFMGINIVSCSGLL